MPTMNEWQQQIAEERKTQEKWQTMTLEHTLRMRPLRSRPVRISTK